MELHINLKESGVHKQKRTIVPHVDIIYNKLIVIQEN